MSGKVHFIGENTCTSNSISSLEAVENIAIQVMNIDSSTTIDTLTDSNGVFSVNIPTGKIKITPSFPTSSDWKNGVSTFDVSELGKHIAKSSKIDCPFQRIAGDVNNDGILDTTDVNIIRDLVLNLIDSFPNVPNWRFVAKNYTMTGEYTKDLEFASDFWNSDYQDNYGKDYPMRGSYTYDNTTTYPYKGLGTIWMDKLNKWQLDSTVVCDTIDWGFYAIKSGDVNGTALLNNFNPNIDEISRNSWTSGHKARLHLTYVDSHGKEMNNSQLKANEKYRIVLSAKIQQPVETYQLGVKVNTGLAALLNLQKGDHFDQPDKKSFSWKPSKGELRIIWIPKSPSKLSGEQLLMGCIIQTKNAIENISDLIYLDDLVLSNLFFDKDGKESLVQLKCIVYEMPKN